jgi:hypothetical protein
LTAQVPPGKKWREINLEGKRSNEKRELHDFDLMTPTFEEVEYLLKQAHGGEKRKKPLAYGSANLYHFRL